VERKKLATLNVRGIIHKEMEVENAFKEKEK
jgi:hypothetical protein